MPEHGGPPGGGDSCSATYADLVAAEAQAARRGQRAELIGGRLLITAVAPSLHQHTASLLGVDVACAFDPGAGGTDPGGWWILRGVELHLADDVVFPHWMGLRRRRLGSLPRGPHLEHAPDWICELVSPDSRDLLMTLKLPLYARHGVGHLWLLDPAQRRLNLYALGDAGFRWLDSHGGDDRIRAPPFAQLELDLSRWWLDPG